MTQPCQHCNGVGGTSGCIPYAVARWKTPCAFCNGTGIASLCMSRGPRIGDEGVPYCKLDKGHTGMHRPAESDGWGKDMFWGDL